MRIVGIIISVFMALFVIWFGSSLIWWQSNQEAVEKAIDQAVVEGEAIGKESTDQECMEVYLDIMRDCSDATCSIQNQVFLKSCLEYSESTSAFCTTIPAKGGIIKFAKWAAQTCLDKHIENSHCAAGLQEAAFYCRADFGL